MFVTHEGILSPANIQDLERQPQNPNRQFTLKIDMKIPIIYTILKLTDTLKIKFKSSKYFV